MTSDHLEIERKYEVDADVALPDLLELPKVAAVEQVLRSVLEAVYSDTDDLALATAGITLRRRTGGSDAGWHLKLPRGGDDRSELGEPLGEDGDQVPSELLDHVRAWVRDYDLHPVATVSTRRVVHRLLDEGGKVLAEVSDDVVTATATARQGEAVVSNWREWEIELVEGSRSLLSAADQLFGASGAGVSAWRSKLHHALGRPSDRRPAPAGELTGRSPAGVVVNAYFGAQIAVILQRDQAVRHDEPDAVHKMRVATRRLRSALSSFRPILDREITDPIRDELKWLAGELGGARDAEVQRQHLLEAVAAEPDDLVLGPVAARIELEMQSDYQKARASLLADLDSARYFRLLDSLDLLLAEPPFTEGAQRRARRILGRRLRHAARKLASLVSEQPAKQTGRDHWLHEIRKAAKRLRYVAEASGPAVKKSAAVAAAAESIQEILGDHQDSVVTRALLRGIGVRMYADGENPFTIGRLHALQQVRADAAEAAFWTEWHGGTGTVIRDRLG